MAEHLTLIPPGGDHIVLTVIRCQIAQQIIKYKKLKKKYLILKLFVFFLSCFRHLFIYSSFVWFLNEITRQVRKHEP
jgi:hypothetical protein